MHGKQIQIKPMPLTAFTSDAAARLTGLSIRQLHHWDRTGFFNPTYADVNRRRPHSRVYSFVDLVGLRTIAELLRRKVTWPDLKQVRTFFGNQTGRNSDWAKRSFYVVGRRVYFTHNEAVLAARPIGQPASPEVLDLGPIVRKIKTGIESLGSRSSADVGRIANDRLILNGADLIAGTRIPTATIFWFHENGYSEGQIHEEFPRISRQDIRAALAHESAKTHHLPSPAQSIA
ncbi:MAG TPA: DUF433 domain-containing protein [Thermomicrobiales bacterium]|nr:DUF433 domain-containing protein [Thermomicrobiales bacterium]